nr:kinesin-like protein KIN-7C, mitochondrial isoform X1 [Ipomoea batatas]
MEEAFVNTLMAPNEDCWDEDIIREIFILIFALLLLMQLAYLPDRKRECMIDDDIGSINSEVSAYDRVDVTDLDELVKDYKRNRRRGTAWLIQIESQILTIPLIFVYGLNGRICFLLVVGVAMRNRLFFFLEVDPNSSVISTSAGLVPLGRFQLKCHVLHYPIIVSNTKPLRFKALGVFPVVGVPVNRPGINDYFGFGGSACAFSITPGFLSISDMAHSVVDAEVSVPALQLVPCSMHSWNFLAFLTWPFGVDAEVSVRSRKYVLASC